MGMFDDIRTEILLPDNPDNDTEFQTKSFDCELADYVISANGELYKEEWDMDYEDMIKIPGTYRRTYLTEYNGDVIFYNGRKVDGAWIEYVAHFVNGKLQQISARYFKY